MIEGSCQSTEASRASPSQPISTNQICQPLIKNGKGRLAGPAMLGSDNGWHPRHQGSWRNSARGIVIFFPQRSSWNYQFWLLYGNVLPRRAISRTRTCSRYVQFLIVITVHVGFRRIMSGSSAVSPTTIKLQRARRATSRMLRPTPFV